MKCSLNMQWRMDNVDAIVVGDGEQAFLDIIQRVDKGEDFSKIPGLMVEKRRW